MLAEIRIRLAHRRQMRLDLTLHVTPEAKLVLLVRKILNVDDDLAASCRRRRMLASLDLRHDNLVRKIHQRVILHRGGLPAASGDVATIGTEGTMVPEPSTWAMMLLGFAGFGLLGYRKMRQRTAAA
jgi:hypothetical protein